MTAITHFRAVRTTLLSHPAVVSVWAIVFATGCAVALIALASDSLQDAILAFYDGAFGSPYAIAASLNRAAALALVGLSFIFAFRANLTNVGGEGQIAVSGIACTALALLPGVGGLPLGLAIVIPMLGGALAGAMWGGLAGVLKVRFGTNEVISTLLLSFIGLWLVYWATHSENLLRQPRTSSDSLPESPPIPEGAELPMLLSDPSAPLHLGTAVVVVSAVAVAIVLRRSIFGVWLRAVGLNEVASRRAGIRYGATVVSALAVAGALSGLAGAIMLLGEQHSLKSGFSSGYGWDGLVIGLLARGSATGVILYSLLFGFLRSGGISMEIFAGVPAAIVLVMQGLIVIIIAGAAYFGNYNGNR